MFGLPQFAPSPAALIEIRENTVDWYVAVVAAFGGAAIGAGLGGWFAFRERVRGARSTLYGHLHTFHDIANDRRRLVQQRGEPAATDDLGKLFRQFDRDAAISSRFDARAVRGVWPMLERIDEVAARYALRDRGNEQAASLARDLAQEQQNHWDELVNYLWHYRRWLEWKATKRWWSIYRNVKMGPIGPDEAPDPPRRLR
jgi:hypothetical protein